MDDATKKMMLTIVTGLAKKAAITISTSLTVHGIAVTGNATEYIASGIVLAVTLGYGVWTDYLKAIVFAQLEVLKAKSLAQAAALHANAIPAPSAAEIADKSPTLTTEQVTKVAATLCLLLAFGMMVATPALAQREDAIPRPAPKRPALTGNIINDIRQRTDSSETQGGGGTDDNSSALRKRLLQALAKPFKDISDIIGDDTTNAIALSTAIPNLKDGHGQQCWIALRDFTDVAKAHPLPLTGQIATDLEAIRLQAIAANRLCSNIHCTQMFTDYSAMAQAVATAAVGALGTLGAKAIPSLSDACSKIPQIPLIEPLDPVPAAADIKPVGWAGEQPAAPAPAEAPK